MDEIDLEEVDKEIRRRAKFMIILFVMFVVFCLIGISENVAARGLSILGLVIIYISVVKEEKRTRDLLDILENIDEPS